MAEGRIEVLKVIEYYRLVHSHIKTFWVINIRHDNIELYEGGWGEDFVGFYSSCLTIYFLSAEISTISFHISL